MWLWSVRHCIPIRECRGRACSAPTVEPDIFARGVACNAPTCPHRKDFHNPMHVIRHNDKRVEGNPRKMIGYDPPTFICNDAVRVENHFSSLHIAEHVSRFCRANGHKIHARLRVISPTQPNRPPMVNVLNIAMHTVSVCMNNRRSRLLRTFSFNDDEFSLSESHL